MGPDDLQGAFFQHASRGSGMLQGGRRAGGGWHHQAPWQERQGREGWLEGWREVDSQGQQAVVKQGAPALAGDETPSGTISTHNSRMRSWCALLLVPAHNGNAEIL